MNAVMKHPALRLAALVLFASTSVIGWKLAEPEAGPSRTEAQEGQVNGKRTERATRHPRSAAADKAGKRMASIRLSGSPEARMRATVDLAHSLSPAPQPPQSGERPAREQYGAGLGHVGLRPDIPDARIP